MIASDTTSFSLFVGIDIAAKSFTVVSLPSAGPANQARTLLQTPQGYTRLYDHLATTGHAPADTLIVMEATSTCWVALAIALVQLGYAVRVVNAAQAHAFAKAVLRRAKTDPVAAPMLAVLAARLQPARWTPPPTVYTELEQRLTHRDSLVTIRTELQNQLHALRHQPVVIRSVQLRLEHLVAELTTQIEAVDQEIADTLQQDAMWAAAAARLQTIIGIGQLTAAWILVTTVTFSLCQTPEAAAAYAGLDPHPHVSGTSVRGRASLGHTGNARLRRMLYLATLSAARYNPIITPLYERLRAAGKPGAPSYNDCIRWFLGGGEGEGAPEARLRVQDCPPPPWAAARPDRIEWL